MKIQHTVFCVTPHRQLIPPSSYKRTGQWSSRPPSQPQNLLSLSFNDKQYYKTSFDTEYPLKHRIRQDENMWANTSASNPASPTTPQIPSVSSPTYRLKYQGRRIAQIVKLKPECVEEYKKCHAKVWPEVLKQIKNSNIEDCKSIGAKLPCKLILIPFLRRFHLPRPWNGDPLRIIQVCRV